MLNVCCAGQEFFYEATAVERSFLVSGVCKEMCTALLLSPSVQGPEGHIPPHEVEMRHLHFVFIVCKSRKMAWSGYRFFR